MRKDEELREEIRDAFCGYAPDVCANCGASLQYAAIAKENTFPDCILAIIKRAGYIKLAEGEPPLLSDEEIATILSSLREDATYGNGLRAVNSAGRDKIMSFLKEG